MTRIAIFASGSGTNAENIIRFFANKSDAAVAAVFCNKQNAAVIEKAQRMGVETVIFGRHEFYDTEIVYKLLVDKEIDLIVLAGFLWLMPENIVNAFHFKIINIHPALLPAYGGKGMYGSRVHEAVIAAGETESGISIHFVNTRYDEGSIIHQSKCSVDENDTPESLAAKIHELEYTYYPEVVYQVAKGNLP